MKYREQEGSLEKRFNEHRAHMQILYDTSQHHQQKSFSLFPNKKHYFWLKKQ